MTRKEPLSLFSFLLCRLDYSTFSRANYPQLSCYIMGLNQNITTFDYIVFNQKCILRSKQSSLRFILEIQFTLRLSKIYYLGW